MRLSTRGLYGLYAMVELGLRYGQGPVMLRDIARHQNIPEKYLEQLIRLLRKARLVRSVRGAHGGYLLARHPKDINLLEVVEALEGPLTLLDCIERPEGCARIPFCATHDVWVEVVEALRSRLERWTLADLVARQREKEGIKVWMYHI